MIGGRLIDMYRFGPPPAPPTPTALLHFDGSDGSTTFTDEFSHTVSLTGGVELDTAQVKFGSASGLFNGTTGYLVMDHADLNLSTVDWTMDCWVYVTSLSVGAFATRALWSTFNVQTSSRVGINVDGSGNVQFYQQGPSGSPLDSFNHANQLAINGWHHIAAVRHGGILRLFLDGVMTTSTFATRNDFTNKCNIGVLDPVAGGFFLCPWNGWVDEFRLVVGTAVWSSSFTPPSSAYSPP